MMFNIVASVAEMERNLIAERTGAGPAAESGRDGRPHRLQEHDIAEARRLRYSGKWKLGSIAVKYKVSRSTIVRAVRSDGDSGVGYGGSRKSSHSQELPGGQSAQKEAGRRAGQSR